jgi:hypothetical protein
VYHGVSPNRLRTLPGPSHLTRAANGIDTEPYQNDGGGANPDPEQYVKQGLHTGILTCLGTAETRPRSGSHSMHSYGFAVRPTNISSPVSMFL